MVSGPGGSTAIQYIQLSLYGVKKEAPHQTIQVKVHPKKTNILAEMSYGYSVYSIQHTEGDGPLFVSVYLQLIS